MYVRLYVLHNESSRKEAAHDNMGPGQHSSNHNETIFLVYVHLHNGLVKTSLLVSSSDCYLDLLLIFDRLNHSTNTEKAMLSNLKLKEYPGLLSEKE